MWQHAKQRQNEKLTLGGNQRTGSPTARMSGQHGLAFFTAALLLCDEEGVEILWKSPEE